MASTCPSAKLPSSSSSSSLLLSGPVGSERRLEWHHGGRNFLEEASASNLFLIGKVCYQTKMMFVCPVNIRPLLVREKNLKLSNISPNY